MFDDITPNEGAIIDEEGYEQGLPPELMDLCEADLEDIFGGDIDDLAMSEGDDVTLDPQMFEIAIPVTDCSAEQIGREDNFELPSDSFKKFHCRTALRTHIFTPKRFKK